jgi:hypothetical protein
MVVELREKLLFLIYITGGQPVYGPEILSIRYTNITNSEYCNIFIEDDIVIFVTRYHKGYAIRGDMKIIHRYLLYVVGEVLVYYLWLVVLLQ